jgi:hypothetical protein
VLVFILPFGEYTLKWIGTGDICFERPVSCYISNIVGVLSVLFMLHMYDIP